MLALNSFLYLENEVTNNLVAYLSRREKDEHDTGLSNTQQIRISAANRFIGEVVQSRRRPLLGPSPG